MIFIHLYLFMTFFLKKKKEQQSHLNVLIILLKVYSIQKM